MMKEEFEKLANCTVSPEDYKGIEQVYMYFEAMFPDKDSIALFYHAFGMGGINRMLCEKAGFERVLSERMKDCHSEEMKYLNEHVKAESIRTFASAVLVSMRDMLVSHNEKPGMDIYEAYGVLASCIFFLDDKVKKLESGDYTI